RYAAVRRSSRSLPGNPAARAMASAIAATRLECPCAAAARWSTAWAAATTTCGPASASIVMRLPSASSSSVTSCGNVHARSLRARRVAGDPRAHLQHEVTVLVAELVVDRLEVVEVDEQQRHRHRCLVLPREDRVQPPAQLAHVVETRQYVGGRLLRASVVAQGVCHRHRRASGKRVHREQVLVAECPAGALEAEER